MSQKSKEKKREKKKIIDSFYRTPGKDQQISAQNNCQGSLDFI
jgi:hypothetical protein